MTFNGQAVRSSGVFLVTPFGGNHDGLLGNTPRSRVAFVIVLIGLLCILSR